MSQPAATGPAPTQLDWPVFTIVGGTTIPDRAAIVRDECREGSHVELRRQTGAAVNDKRINVLLECRPLLGLLKTWKEIGFVPDETAEALSPISTKAPPSSRMGL